MSYQMHRPGFDRRRACRGHFTVPEVRSDESEAERWWDSERRDSPYSTVADASDDSYCEVCDQETVEDDRAYGGVRCGCDRDYPIYSTSKGGQDVYVETIVAQSPTEALERFAKANGVEVAFYKEVGCQARIETTGVIYYYTYLS